MTTLVSEPKPCNSKRCSKDCRYKVYYYTPKRKEKHFKYLKDAKGWAQDKLRTMSLGLVSSEQVDKMTLNDFRENVLLSKGNETTLARANANYDNHIRETIGPYRIKDITRPILQDFFDDEMIGYAPATQRKIKHLLNVCFKYASADGYISRNPAELIHIEGESREYIPTQLKPVELAEFIEVWDSHELLKEYANYVVGLAYTGARPQELGALTWDDIDLQARTLDINKAIKTTHTGKQFVSNILKTESASRVLGIDEVLLARLRFRKTTNPSDTYVFSSSRGEMINLNNFRSRYWNKALMLSSVNISVPYDLRHTYSALMWSRDVPLDKLSRRMGHKNISTTQNWYGGWYRQADFTGLDVPSEWKTEQA